MSRDFRLIPGRNGNRVFRQSRDHSSGQKTIPASQSAIPTPKAGCLSVSGLAMSEKRGRQVGDH